MKHKPSLLLLVLASIFLTACGGGATLLPVSDQLVSEGDTLSLSLVLDLAPEAPPVDGEAVSFSAENLPPFGTVINNLDGTGEIEFQPRFDDSGVYIMTAIADHSGTISKQIFTLTVENVNRFPSITSIAPTSGLELSIYTYTIQ
ncbi:MAG: hypothetical protein JKY54_15175, partial [Flavobacteriales bacterium]|nr:hypothetical protein [Flavobacteriales bacterium]